MRTRIRSGNCRDYSRIFIHRHKIARQLWWLELNWSCYYITSTLYTAYVGKKLGEDLRSTLICRHGQKVKGDSQGSIDNKLI